MKQVKYLLVAVMLLSCVSASSANNPLLSYQEYSQLSASDRLAYMKLISKYFIAREKAERPSDYAVLFETMGLLPEGWAEDTANGSAQATQPVPTPNPMPAPARAATVPLPKPKPDPAVSAVPIPRPRPTSNVPASAATPAPQAPANAAGPLPPRPEYTAPPASPSSEVAADSDSEEQRRQNQMGAARAKDAAEGLDVAEHEGDCINAGFNFIRKKGKKGACRGISDLCQKEIGTSIRGIPPLELLAGQFCVSGKDSPNGRCGSPGLLGPKVVCDPLLFGVVKGENGKAKVMCVERSRNSTAACAKLSESTTDIKVVCSQGINNEACLAGENPQADLSRAYHQKILVMARDCKWTDDPLANRGVGAFRADRSAKAQKDITDTCNAIKPRLGVFKQLAQTPPQQPQSSGAQGTD